MAGQGYRATPDTFSDERLMARCAKGDTSAFDELYRRYAAFIGNFVARKISDRGQAEDVTQEVFLRLYRSAAGFDPSRQLRRWLFTIAANEVRRYWSRNSRSPLSLSRNAANDGSSADFEELLPDSHEGPDDVYLNSITSEK
jgi:RNA polymerase sigma factor (sigma-70 family)